MASPSVAKLPSEAPASSKSGSGQRLHRLDYVDLAPILEDHVSNNQRRHDADPNLTRFARQVPERLAELWVNAELIVNSFESGYYFRAKAALPGTRDQRPKVVQHSTRAGDLVGLRTAGRLNHRSQPAV